MGLFPGSFETTGAAAGNARKKEGCCKSDESTGRRTGFRSCPLPGQERNPVLRSRLLQCRPPASVLGSWRLKSANASGYAGFLVLGLSSLGALRPLFNGAHGEGAIDGAAARWLATQGDAHVFGASLEWCRLVHFVHFRDAGPRPRSQTGAG